MKASELLELLEWLDKEIGEGQKEWYLNQMAKKLTDDGYFVGGATDMYIINTFIATRKNETQNS